MRTRRTSSGGSASSGRISASAGSPMATCLQLLPPIGPRGPSSKPVPPMKMSLAMTWFCDGTSQPDGGVIQQ
eukprot:11169366-Lingulodinium_polyedra.AAC.1